MKVIFLDMDGVLNSDTFLIDNSRRNPGQNPMDRWPGGHINPANVQMLDALVTASGARIVLSSAWRTHIELQPLYLLLKERGYTGPELIGRTTSELGNQPPRYKWVPRGLEIQHWLDNTTEDVESFVILDDMENMVHLSDRYIQTDPIDGLTSADVERAIKILLLPVENRGRIAI